MMQPEKPELNCSMLYEVLYVLEELLILSEDIRGSDLAFVSAFDYNYERGLV